MRINILSIMIIGWSAFFLLSCGTNNRVDSGIMVVPVIEPVSYDNNPEDDWGKTEKKDTEAITAVGDDFKEQEEIYLNSDWEYSDFSVISNDCAVLYRAKENRKNVIVGVDAGHGTTGALGKRTYSHPDKSPRTTGDRLPDGTRTNKALVQSVGMAFTDGTIEGVATLKTARALKDALLADGYDVLMLRDKEAVELDLMARIVIANNNAACHISLHFDGDALSYDKGAFYLSVPNSIKKMPPVDRMWQEDDRLGEKLIEGLRNKGIPIFKRGFMAVDLVQTAFSTIPSVVVELGNQHTPIDEGSIYYMAQGLLDGINNFFGLPKVKYRSDIVKKLKQYP